MADNQHAEPADLPVLAELPSYLLTRIANQYSQNVHAQLKAVGLTSIASRVIITLKACGALTVGELCAHSIANQPTMSRALDRLEAKGLVERRIGGEDGRARIVRLTDKGALLFGRIWPVVLGANEEMMAGISEQDREITMRTLERMFNNTQRTPW